MTPRTIVDLVDVEQELFELPQKVCISLAKAVTHILTAEY